MRDFLNNAKLPHLILTLSKREKLAVCDVTNLPYMDINWQSISIYGYFVTSLVAYYSRADINQQPVFPYNTSIYFIYFPELIFLYFIFYSLYLYLNQE